LLRINEYFDELLKPTSDANPLGGQASPQEGYCAMVDGAGFGLIATEFQKLPTSLLPRATLKDVLKGPLLAFEENMSH